MSLAGKFLHIMAEAQRQADRVARMRDGRLAALRCSGNAGSPGSDANGTYGRWGYTPWTDFRWKT